ncbi:MAG: transposase [Pseudomonadota bacterium]
MAGRQESPEETVSKLLQVEMQQGEGATIAEADRQVDVAQETVYRWRRLYGEMQRSHLSRLKELKKENQLLRRTVSELKLVKLILSEASKGGYIRPLSSDL